LERLTPEEEEGYADTHKQKHLTPEQIEYEERRKQRVKEETLRKHQIVARREGVFALSSRGNTQLEISRLLGISQAQVSYDLQAIKKEMASKLRDFIDKDIILIYQQSMRGLSDVIKSAWLIHDTPGVPENIKLSALSLIADVNSQRFDLSCSSEIIQQGVSYISRQKEHLNNMVRAVPQEQVRTMLREEIEDHKQQPQQQEQQEQKEAEDTNFGDDDIVRLENGKSSADDATIDSAVTGGSDMMVKESNGIVVENDSSPPPPPPHQHNHQTQQQQQKQQQQQSNEDLSLTDPEPSHNNPNDDDNDNTEEDPGDTTTNNMVF
jgi:DNA-binding CsgD family transcriptional regulator